MDPLQHPRIEFQRRERAVCHRMIMLAMVIVVGFTGISVRLYWLQVRHADELAAKAAKLRLTKDTLPALRGSILDANGQLLAQDRILHDFYADKKHIQDPKFARPRLARLMGITQAQLRTEMTDAQVVDAYRARIAKDLSPHAKMEEGDLLKLLMPGGKSSPLVAEELLTDEADQFKIALEDPRPTKMSALYAVYERERPDRFRPLGDERLSHVLGLVTKEQVKDNKVLPRKGAEGMEERMERVLAGVEGFEYLERDATRLHVLPGFAGQVQPAQHGRHVVLTIDMHLQQMLEDLVARGYKEHAPNKIMAVLVDPNTGSILAMASEPRVQMIVERPSMVAHYDRRNMAVTDLYEPGSTMKLITLAAALDSGVASLDSQFFCHDGFYQESKDVWVRDDESNGTLSVKGILAHSSNIGAYLVAKRLGSPAFYDYIKRFGLGDRTALAMPREPAGRVRPVEEWQSTSLSRVAMGYEVSVTPLQMAMVVSTIANGGKLMQPRLVDRILSVDRSESESVDPVVVRHVCSPRTAAKMTEAMEAVVIEGTGKRAALEGVRAAGKTGTAQRFDPATKKYEKGHFVVSFVGFAPVEHPRFACVVILDDPKADDHHDLYGGKLAAPLWKDIMTSALAQIGIPAVATTSPEENQ